MIRVFGPALYREVMGWPRRLILRAAEIQTQREADARLTALTDLSIATGLKLGMEYVDPKNPSGSRKADEPYHTLEPLAKHKADLDRVARPWAHTPEAVQARLDWEQDRAYAALFGTLRA